MKIDTGFNNLILSFDKTILTFGKTGAGKTSILNSLTEKNLFLEGGDGYSTTKDIHGKIFYLFNDLSKFNALFIDTPGSCDTNNQDYENMEKISDFTKKIGVSIILFAISILESKIDMTIINTINCLIKIFGEEVMSRTYFVITHLNSIAQDKRKSKIDLFNNTFNESVKSNKNDLLFYDYEDNENKNGLAKIEEILINQNIIYKPISKEKKLKLDIVNTSIEVLKSKTSLLLEAYKTKESQVFSFKKDLDTEILENYNRGMSEIMKFKANIEKRRFLYI